MIESSLVVEDAWTTVRARLVRWLTARTRDPWAAEEIAQEAFLRLIVEVEAGRAPRDAGAWLHQVSANLVTSRGRHQSVADRRAGELPLPSNPASPESMAVASEDASMLRAALGSLPDTDREALLLAAHGWRGAEIADRIGRSDGATRTLLSRARGRLRQQLLASGFSAS